MYSPAGSRDTGYKRGTVTVQEGLPTVALGVWIWYTLAPTPQEAAFLTQAERDYVSRTVQQNKV